MARFIQLVRPYLAVVAATILLFLPPILGGPNITGALAIVPIIVGASMGGLAPGLFATSLILVIATVLLMLRPDGVAVRRPC